MKQSLELLLSKLENIHISRHIISPSANIVLKLNSIDIPNSTEIIDERSAGYVATGMCDELGEPVVLWCADNDSFRSLAPSLTEAYYRKLPILIVALSFGSAINQTINPYDTIRYYANSSSAGSNDVEVDIKAAIDYLHMEVKGPVYLSIGRFEEERQIVFQPFIGSLQPIDATSIINLLPSDACVHIGSNVLVKGYNMCDIVCRNKRSSSIGNLSMLIGASLVAQKQLHIGIFVSEDIVYDLNMFGNHHIGNNVLILSLQRHSHNQAIFDFAKKMSWECMQVSMKDIATIKDSLHIGAKSKYIEIVI